MKIFEHWTGLTYKIIKASPTIGSLNDTKAELKEFYDIQKLYDDFYVLYESEL